MRERDRERRIERKPELAPRTGRNVTEDRARKVGRAALRGANESIARKLGRTGLQGK